MKKSENRAERKRARARRDTVIVLAFLAVLAALLVFVIVWGILGGHFTSPSTPTEPSTEPTAPPTASTESVKSTSETDDRIRFDIEGFAQDETFEPIDLPATQLGILAVGGYSGAYCEDGSDEAVENVWALVVENASDTLVEYAQFSLESDGQTVDFEVSGLPGGCRCFVLAQDRAAYSGDKVGILSCVGYSADSGRAVLDFGGEFELYPADGVLNLKNISGETVASPVYLCYKTYRDGLFWGGITYRASFGEDFAADEIRQCLQTHYSEDESVILYMLYDKD